MMFPIAAQQVLAQQNILASSEYAWTKQKWLPQVDKQFEKIESSLGRMSEAQLLLRIKKPLAANPQASSLFDRGTAGYLLRMKFKNSRGENAISEVLRQFPLTSTPDSYRFARLKFLIIARQSRHQELRSLGIRLARKNSKDYDVRYLLTNLLKPEMNQADKKLALQNLQEMTRLQPNRPSLFSLRGKVYYRLWLVSRSQSDRNNSISSYKRYLQIAHKHDPFRFQAQRLVTQLQTYRP